MSELLIARQYLYSRLSSHLECEVYPLGEVEAGAVMPYATFDITPEPDRMSKTATEQSNMEAVCRVVGEGSLGPLEAHLAAIGKALDFGAGEVGEFQVLSRRIAPWHLPTYFREGSNVPQRELGFRFRLVLTAKERQLA